jgi:D-xylonolactonase
MDENKNTELRVIANCGDLVGECPVWDAETSSLYWTDFAGEKFYCYRWISREAELIKRGIEITGFAVNESGGFIVANTRGIWFWDGSGAMRLLVSEVDNVACRMNDAIADPVGRFLAGTCFYKPDQRYPLGQLIRVETGGEAAILDDGIHLANGLAFSPDCATLYLTDSALRTIYAYDYDVKSGNVAHRRVVVNISDTEGIPDGLTVDAEGFIWSAQWYGSCAVRYDPDGKIERRIPCPAKQPSSLAFGGKDLTDLFITSAGNSFPSPLMPAGYDAKTGHFGGELYHVNLGIPGRLEFKTKMPLSL